MPILTSCPSAAASTEKLKIGSSAFRKSYTPHATSAVNSPRL
ncbi:MAG: hypothetical protein O3A00_13010 [Planctomycetota bacterium]|nr:hypothetical protein [Planctomycetota bacterium]